MNKRMEQLLVDLCDANVDVFLDDAKLQGQLRAVLNVLGGPAKALTFFRSLKAQLKTKNYIMPIIL